jgi:hypothetical protein
LNGISHNFKQDRNPLVKKRGHGQKVTFRPGVTMLFLLVNRWKRGKKGKTGKYWGDGIPGA